MNAFSNSLWTCQRAKLLPQGDHFVDRSGFKVFHLNLIPCKAPPVHDFPDSFQFNVMPHSDAASHILVQTVSPATGYLSSKRRQEMTDRVSKDSIMFLSLNNKSTSIPPFSDIIWIYRKPCG